MSYTVIELMLSIREDYIMFYHKDTNEFDYLPFSSIEEKTLSPDAIIPLHNYNNFRLPDFEEIDNEEIMRYYVREHIEDKGTRKVLFSILSRHKYMDAFLEKLTELNLYDDFIDVCGSVYVQLFEEWAERNGLEFK